MQFLEMGAAKYVALETFKKDGSTVNTPVWVVRSDNKLYVTTDAESWKVKRIKNNGRVRLAPSDARGTPKGAFVDGAASIIDHPQSVANFEPLFRRKYPMMRVFGLLGRLRGGTRVIIEIEPIEIGVNV